MRGAGRSSQGQAGADQEILLDKGSDLCCNKASKDGAGQGFEHPNQRINLKRLSMTEPQAEG